MKKIAVVEDNPDNQLLVQAILEDQYEISLYDTGPQALDGLQAQMPDLMLLGISLPEMDGTQVLEQLRESDRFRHLPVIALTAHAMVGDREKYLAKGFNEYLASRLWMKTCSWK